MNLGMQKSKFISVFYNLSPHEKIAFKKWVYSPFFNKNELLRKLLDYFYPINLEKDRQLLNRQLVYAAIFGNKPFDNVPLRYLSSELMQLLEQFLVFQYRKTKNIDFQLDLSQIYKEKGFNQLCQQSIQKANKQYKKHTYQDIQQLNLDYKIESIIYHSNVDKDRSTSNNLQALNNSFDKKYLAEKLKHSCRILSHQGMYTQQYDTGLLKEVLDYLANHSTDLETPAIGLYYYYYMASTSLEEETTFFQKFKQYLFLYQALFEREEVRDLYILATNYSIKRMNTDQRDYYLQEAFELYQQALKANILLENDKISPFAFTNIVAIGIGLKKYPWIWEFIQEYTTFLPNKIRKAYTDFNLSRWYFHQKQYQKAAELLVADDFEDLHLNLSAKMLLLKIYYELGEFQLLEALFNRFRTYLSRQKELVYHKKNYNNIIRFTQRLVSINPFSAKAKLKLQKDIEKVDLLTEKTWLLEQLGQL
jgi:hypothetical protein